jgi:endonuclease/exonuclease/phosphatase family metal-dependent hydrolase
MAPRSSWRLLLATILLLALAPMARAGALPITPDGVFDDWTAAAQETLDPSGDGGGSGIDFTHLEIAHDGDWVFLRLDTTVEVQPDEQQDIRFYLDTDMNAATGYSINGIGADLVWELGQRTGTFYTPSPQTIDHPDIGLTIAPTVSATEFELALRRDAVPAGGQPLFPGNDFRIVITDNASGGDRLPDSGAVSYTLDATSFPIATVPLEQTPSTIRVAGYNVQSDGLFDTGSAHQTALEKIFSTVDAQVWVICEVWNHTAEEVRQVVEGYLPSGSGENWYALKLDSGNVIVSRFPILLSWEVSPGDRITAALLDARPTWDSDLMVIANHWSCCTADDNRQRQADATVAFLRDAMTPGGNFTLAEDTPVILAGDFNLVGWRQQLDTLVSGDIQDEGTYGSDFAPDWGTGSLSYALSRHPDARMVYTWRQDSSSFYPGMLDYLFYTPSVITLDHGYVLETRTMKSTTLASYGLSANTTPDASDHAPRVGDFSLNAVTATPPSLARGVKLLPNVPNPFNPRTTLRFTLTRAEHIRLEIVDPKGRRVRTLVDALLSAGNHEIVWNGSDDGGRAVASGVYRMVLLGADGSSQSRPMVLVR